MDLSSPGTGQDLRLTSRSTLVRAIDFGESYAKNVSKAAFRYGGGSTYTKSSPEWYHYVFLKPKAMN